jgi:aspartyl-tRNA(Asn)/glutamyl-tRNA(Gln) amidotransferase subunit A
VGPRRLSTDLATLTATEQAALIRARWASPVEITRTVLARIAAWESRFNAFATPDEADATAAARRAEAAFLEVQPFAPAYAP